MHFSVTICMGRWFCVEQALAPRLQESSSAKTSIFFGAKEESKGYHVICDLTACSPCFYHAVHIHRGIHNSLTMEAHQDDFNQASIFDEILPICTVVPISIS